MVNSELCRLTRAATEDIPHVVGRLVFGSHASSSTDDNSDIDTLILILHGSTKREIRTYDDYEFDLEILSEEVLAAQLDVKKWNNNVPLLALESGITVDDKTGALSRLRLKAKELWSLGTGELSELDCMLLLAASSKSRHAAEKLTTRLLKSYGAHDIAYINMQLGAVHLSLSTIYLRSRRCWVYPPWVITKLKEACYRELASINRRIFEAGNPMVKLEGLVELADQARSRL